MSRDFDHEELYYRLLEDVKGYLGTDEFTDEADEALAKACKLLVEEPSLDDYHEDDPNGRYQMFTAEGNKAAAEMVTTLSDVMERGGVARIDLPSLVESSMREVAKTHPEIYDTEPRGAISDGLSETCDKLGWKPIDL